jgi:hypothetical protein
MFNVTSYSGVWMVIIILSVNIMWTDNLVWPAIVVCEW